MNILINVLLVVSTFLFMEGVAWFTHKYIMHGFLWSWHESHHKPSKGRFEKNDRFALVFSLPSVVLFFYSTYYTDTFYLTSVAIGILAYGIFYVVFHDIIYHQRIKFRKNWTGSYMKRMIRAHTAHHRRHSKDGCESFGFLIVDKKYEKK